MKTLRNYGYGEQGQNKPNYGDLFRQGFLREPGALNRARAARSGGDFEQAPVSQMVGSSLALQLAREYLPSTVGEIELIKKLASRIPKGMGRETLLNAPAGGYSQAQKKEIAGLRAQFPEVREVTGVANQATLPGRNQELDISDNLRARATVAAGQLAGDLATDGMRNIWWFLNAPQAIAQIMMLQGMHTANKRTVKDLDLGASGRDLNRPVFKSRNLRMAAAAPAWLAVSMGLGNFSRNPGYKAVVPDENDPTKTANPVQEFVDRYFLGRSGKLLPYDEFVKERPDVSRQEYNQYKNYLFGNKGVLKATMDGIEGPEVNFMGKSVPLMTGILPGAAAVIGARRGIRRGMEKIKASGGYKKEERARDLVGRVIQDEQQGKVMPSGKRLRVETAARKRERYNDQQLAKQVIKDTSIATGGTAAIGALLESLRRANKPQQDTES